MSINLRIRQIKNIEDAEITFPFEKGLYAIVGENGCGKSTLMLAMSFMVRTSSAHLLKAGDIYEDSIVDITADGLHDLWHYNPKRSELTTGKFQKRGDRHVLIASAHVEGFYEGSIFYGRRFDDFNVIDKFIESPNYEYLLADADPFVIETLGYILHNDKTYYKNLKKIKTRAAAQEFGFNGIPYFMQIGQHIISQYKMSSGESMLISLIDFLNNVIIRRPSRKSKLLFLIDEVELALHPSAIDRLVLFLSKLVETASSDLVIYFSTHSAELIHRISPKNIFLIENDKGQIEITNPCYPNYAVRNLYVPNGFDFLLLVEDELSKTLVEKVIRENKLSKSKLCCVLPAGGCTQMLKLHSDMLSYNTLGVGKHIVSIYDGDAKCNVLKKDEYKSLPKCFLPIPSIEKYLKKKLITEKDKSFIRLLGDKYFSRRSLDDILKDYLGDPRTQTSNDSDGKNLYRVICSNLNAIGITEKDFVKYLCDDIYEYEDLTKFVASMTNLLK